MPYAKWKVVGCLFHFRIRVYCFHFDCKDNLFFFCTEQRGPHYLASGAESLKHGGIIRVFPNQDEPGISAVVPPFPVTPNKVKLPPLSCSAS